MDDVPRGRKSSPHDQEVRNTAVAKPGAEIQNMVTPEKIHLEVDDSKAKENSRPNAPNAKSGETSQREHAKLEWFSDFTRKRIERAASATVRADDVFYAYYNESPYVEQKNVIALAPHQMLLTVVASPHVSVQQHKQTKKITTVLAINSLQLPLVVGRH